MPIVESAPAVNQKNVGRLAERIVANELEWRGFRVSDLNKEGLSPNADLIAAGHGKLWQIQVKGTSNNERRWGVQYGHCTTAIIEKHEKMFNKTDSFYKADFVVLVAVRAPNDYCCIVLSTEDAERAAQLNLDRCYRTLTQKGEKRKPHKMWVHLEPTDKIRDRHLIEKEREILRKGQGAWEILNAGAA